MEATKMSIDRWMDKKFVVIIHNGILLNYKKKCTWVSSNDVDEPGAYYTDLKRERQILYVSVQFSHSVVSNLKPHGLQHTRPPCLSPTPRVYSDSCPLSRWWHPTISSSVVPFSSYPQSFPASGSFQMSQFFTWGGQSIGVSASASVLPMNIQDWFPLGFPLESYGNSVLRSLCTVLHSGCANLHSYRVGGFPFLCTFSSIVCGFFHESHLTGVKCLQT